MKQLTMIAAFVVAAVAQTVAASADGVEAKHKKCQQERKAKMLSAGDTDQNGVLSEAEREVLAAKKRAEHLVRFDADRDGTLSKKERASARHEHLVSKFESIDSSGDAMISLAEAAASCGPLGKHFERVDANSDNRISWTEFESAAPKRRRRGRGHRGPPR